MLPGGRGHAAKQQSLAPYGNYVQLHQVQSAFATYRNYRPPVRQTASRYLPVSSRLAES